jgi:hypothetical protein
MSASGPGDGGRRPERTAAAARTASSAGRRLGSASVRILRAWGSLSPERRLAAMASLALFMTLFLPWYQESVIANGGAGLRSLDESLSGWSVFSPVEAAVLLVAAAVLVLLFFRAEGQAFHVPGGDGGVIMAAGFWTCVLVIWRIFDKQGTTDHGQYATTWGIEWGIFIALGVAGLLTYAGSRIRAAHDPEPPLPGEPAMPAGSPPSSRRPSAVLDLDDTWSSPGRAAARGGGAATDRGAPGAPGTPAAPATPVSGGAPGSSGSAGAPGGGRKRPRSIGAPAPGRVDAPGTPERDPSEQPTRQVTSSERDAGPRARRPPLDVREIAELDIAEPPTARLGRPAPPTAPPPSADAGDADDQLTLRLDRPR